MYRQFDCLIFVVISTALYGAETWTFRAVDQKHLESLEMCCWRRMEKISCTDRVRNEEVLLRVNEQRNILHEISKRKANWIAKGYTNIYVTTQQLLLNTTLFCTWRHVSAGHTAIFRPAYNRTGPFYVRTMWDPTLFYCKLA